MSLHQSEEASRTVVAESIAEWAAAHNFTPDDLTAMEGVDRIAVARFARQNHPTLHPRWGYAPSDATWDLAVRLLVIQPSVAPADDDDPFRGFPQ